jgi:hypothetical protein
MKPPGRTTLARMQLTAWLEAERIEISQDARVAAGARSADTDQVAIRDDLMGVVRLIDAIESDQSLKQAIANRLDQMRVIKLAALAKENTKEETEVEAE